MSKIRLKDLYRRMMHDETCFLDCETCQIMMATPPRYYTTEEIAQSSEEVILLYRGGDVGINADCYMPKWKSGFYFVLHDNAPTREEMEADPRRYLAIPHFNEVYCRYRFMEVHGITPEHMMEYGLPVESPFADIFAPMDDDPKWMEYLNIFHVLCEDMRIEGEFNIYYRQMYVAAAVKWCEDNGIEYYDSDFFK